MPAMPQDELIAKTAELKTCVTRLNALARELAFEGCKIEVDTTALSGMGWQSEVPVVSVKVLKEVAA